MVGRSCAGRRVAYNLRGSIMLAGNLIIQIASRIKFSTSDGSQNVSRVFLLVLYSMLTFTYLVLSSYTAATEAQTRDPSYLDTQAQLFETWLKDTGLSDHLALVKIRYARHPNPDIERKIYRLELRMIPKRDSAEENIRYLEMLNTRVLEAIRISLHEKIFRKFVGMLRVPATEVSSHIHVGETDFMTYLDREERPTTTTSNPKMVHRHTEIALDAIPALHSVWTGTIQERLPNQQLLTTEQVEEFFKSYYKTKSAKVEVIDITPRRLELHISQMKGQIIPNQKYWEGLEVSIYLDLQQHEAILDCHFDGRYAPGLSGLPPKDGAFKSMEPEFAKRLTDYGGMLLVELKTHLTKYK